MEPLSMGAMGRTNDQQCPVCLVPHFPFCNHAHPSVAYPPHATFPGQPFPGPRPMAEASFRRNHLASVPPSAPDFHQGHPLYASHFPSRNDQFYQQRIEHASAARVFLPGSSIAPQHFFPRHHDLTHSSAQHFEHNLPPMTTVVDNPPGHPMVNYLAEGGLEKEQLFFQQQGRVAGATDTLSSRGFGFGNGLRAKAPRFNEADNLQPSRQIVDPGLEQMGYKTGMFEADEATRATLSKSQPYDSQKEQYLMARETLHEGSGAAFEQGTVKCRDGSSQGSTWLGKGLPQFDDASSNLIDISYRERVGWSQQADVKSSDYRQGGGPCGLSERTYIREDGQAREPEVENDFRSAQASAANNIKNQPETRKGLSLGKEEYLIEHSLQTFEHNEQGPVQSDSRAQHSSLAKVLDARGSLEDYPSREPASEGKSLKRKRHTTEGKLYKPMSREEELLIEQGLLDDDSSGSESPNYPSMGSKEVLAAQTQSLLPLLRSVKHGKDSQSESYNSNQWERIADRSLAGRFSNNLAEHVSSWPAIDQCAVDHCDKASSNEQLYARGLHASHDGLIGDTHSSFRSGTMGQYGNEGTERGKDILPRQYQHWEAEQQHMEALIRAKEIAREIQQREDSFHSLNPPLVQDAHVKEQHMPGLAQKQAESRMEQQELSWQSSTFQTSDIPHPSFAHSRSPHHPNYHYKPYSQENYRQERHAASGQLTAFQQECQSVNAAHKEQLEPHAWHHDNGALSNFHMQGSIPQSQNSQLSALRSQGEKKRQHEQQLQPHERRPLDQRQFEDYHQNRKHYAEAPTVQTQSTVLEGSRRMSAVNAPSTRQVQGTRSTTTDSTLGVLNHAAQYASSGVQEPHTRSFSSYSGTVSIDPMIPNSPHSPSDFGPPLPPDAPPPLPPLPSLSAGPTSYSAAHHRSLNGESFSQSHLPQSQGLSLQCVDSRPQESLQMGVHFMSHIPASLSGNQHSQHQEKSKVVDAATVFRNPGRLTRPDRFVVILRGLPGSGKSYLAKALRDIEVMNGGNAPRIHSMDDYFMSEVEKIEDDVISTSGLKSRKKIVKRVMEYCYEPEMEEAYRASMLKAFKKTLEEGMFSFVIVDDRNVLVADFSQFWAIAKRSGYEVYILEASYKDVKGCAARNVHSFMEDQIQSMVDRWEATPSLYLNLDVSSLFRGDDLNDQDIIEVEMDADDMERDLEEDEDNSHPSDEQFSKPTYLRDKDKPVLGDKWEDKADQAAEKAAALTKSRNHVEDSSKIEHTRASSGKGNALSGLMTTYGKTNKFVHWSDNQGVKGGVKGFSIGHKSDSLIIGPGPGYNVISNPLVEDTDKNLAGSSRRSSKFVEQLRAEQETFKAAFARRRQRIGGMEEEDDD